MIEFLIFVSAGAHAFLLTRKASNRTLLVLSASIVIAVNIAHLTKVLFPYPWAVAALAGLGITVLLILLIRIYRASNLEEFFED